MLSGAARDDNDDDDDDDGDDAYGSYRSQRLEAPSVRAGQKTC